MKVRVVYKPNGTVAVIHYAPKSRLSYEQAMAKCMKESGLEQRPFDDIDESALPQTRKYRQAWRGQKGVGITIDSAVKDNIDARPTEQQQKQLALAERIVSLKAARNELTGDAALACQREVERLSQELANA